MKGLISRYVGSQQETFESIVPINVDPAWAFTPIQLR
jgi:hypothetical protein